MKVCETIKQDVKKGFKSGLKDQLSKVGDYKVYLHKNLENKSSKDKTRENNWLDKGLKCKDSDMKATIITISSNYTKEKLIHILKNKVLIS